jgi:hypothetical protein
MRRLGFQYTYDKTIYERLLHGTAEMLRMHLSADAGWQDGCLRFLETHDEPRAAAALPWDRHRAAAVIAGSVPGMTLIHDGQLDGRLVKTPIQLRRRAPEQVNGMVQAFYSRLLTTLANDDVVRHGRWRLFGVRPAWDDNPTWQHFIAYGWHLPGRDPRVIAVNFGPTQGQCYVDLRELEPGTSERPIGFQDLLAGGQDAFVRDPAGLFREGLYLDLPAFGFHLFAVSGVDGDALSARWAERNFPA